MEEDELDRFFEAKQREGLRDHAAEIKPRSSRDQAEIRPRSGRDQAELRARARLVKRRCEGVETFARVHRETWRHEQHLRCDQFARRLINESFVRVVDPRGAISCGSTEESVRSSVASTTSHCSQNCA